MPTRPQVIFLDAVGTLFGVQGSVGEQYAKVVARFNGAHMPVDRLNREFILAFKAAGSPAFPDLDPALDLAALRDREFAWWKQLAVQTFTNAQVIEQIPEFDRFFESLFAYFATAEPWFIYPDVVKTLQRWQNLGVPMGVLSNFDSRLYSVLHELNLIDYFSSITISTESGFAKPDRRIFDLALHKHECPAAAAWHIGDSYNEDFQAAKNAGLYGIWLKR